MKERLFRGAAPLAATALAVALIAGPALAGGQDAGENGNPRGGTLGGDAGFAEMAMLCKEAADAWTELTLHPDPEHALACAEAEEALWR